jgi:hypothetical protein
MTLPALFTLAAEYHDAARALADMDCDEQTITDTLEAMGGDLQTKCTNIAALVKNLEALGDAIDTAQKQMDERKRHARNRAARLRDYLKNGMEFAGIREITTPHFALKIVRNPASVIIEDAEQLPVEFVILPPIPPAAPDRAAIRTAIKSGKTVPGARLDDTKTRLDIR